MMVTLDAITSRFSRWISRWGDRLFSVAGAFLFAQAPLFVQEYQQQLLGRMAEQKWQIDFLEHHLKEQGRSLGEYLQKLLQFQDADVALQGELLKKLLSRYQETLIAYQSLSEATVFTKPYLFIRHMNWDNFEATVSHFQPGILFTFEGLAYALIGAMVGCLCFGAIKGLLRLLAWPCLQFIRSKRAHS